MANTVIALKKSGTPSAIPVDLANGELAINYADGKIFYKSAAGSIQEISGGGNSFGTVNANGVLIVSDTTGDVLTLVPGNGITIVGDSINDSITISSVADVSLPYNTANAAFDKANDAYNLANNVGPESPASSQTFVANGAQTIFFLANNISHQNNTMVSVDGLLQIPEIHYTISGNNLIFTTEPINKSNIEVRVFQTNASIFGVIDGNVSIYLSDLYNYVNSYTSAAFTTANTAYSSSVLKTGNTMTGNLVMSSANVTFVTQANNGLYWSNTGLSYIHSPAANTIVFGTSSIERMRIDENGAVTAGGVGLATTGKAIAMAIVFG